MFMLGINKKLVRNSLFHSRKDCNLLAVSKTWKIFDSIMVYVWVTSVFSYGLLAETHSWDWSSMIMS